MLTNFFRIFFFGHAGRETELKLLLEKLGSCYDIDKQNKYFAWYGKVRTLNKNKRKKKTTSWLFTIAIEWFIFVIIVDKCLDTNVVK